MSDCCCCCCCCMQAKTLTEHLVSKFDGLPPVVIVRPSIVAVSSDGSRGSRGTPGCVCTRVMLSPVGRFMPATGIADNLFVDDVASRVVDAVVDVSAAGESSVGARALSTCASPAKVIAHTGLKTFDGIPGDLPVRPQRCTGRRTVCQPATRQSRQTSIRKSGSSKPLPSGRAPCRCARSSAAAAQRHS
eukprot:SAG31_NODE_5486_length_2512_cov_1.878989_3_plen_189_part_00